MDCERPIQPAHRSAPASRGCRFNVTAPLHFPLPLNPLLSPLLQTITNGSGSTNVLNTAGNHKGPQRTTINNHRGPPHTTMIQGTTASTHVWLYYMLNNNNNYIHKLLFYFMHTLSPARFLGSGMDNGLK